MRARGLCGAGVYVVGRIVLLALVLFAGTHPSYAITVASSNFDQVAFIVSSQAGTVTQIGGTNPGKNLTTATGPGRVRR
jgi:hypothetical protein